MPSRVDIVDRAVQHVRDQVVDHPLAGALADAKSLAAVRTFTEHHVWAVWDFMWLLGALRQRFTCTTVPWTPPASATAARLVNEIVVGEESDEHPHGGHISHFGWYVEAMHELGADTVPIHAAHYKVAAGAAPLDAMQEAQAPAAAIRFTTRTLDFVAADDATLLGAFCFGRETLIPEMFGPLSRGVGSLLLEYMDRHIEIDGEHGPLTERLVADVCRDDPTAWLHLIGGARAALVARRRLWDDTLTAIQENQ